MAWKGVHVGTHGDDLLIGGVRVWRADWRRVQDDPIELPHPAYPSDIQPYWIYEIGPRAEPVRFAATELSPSVWGFYIPE